MNKYLELSQAGKSKVVEGLSSVPCKQESV
jgi:hypothetical protein